MNITKFLLYFSLCGLIGNATVVAENAPMLNGAQNYPYFEGTNYEHASGDVREEAYLPSEPCHMDDCLGDPCCNLCKLPDFCLYAGYTIGKGVGYKAGYGTLGLTTSCALVSNVPVQGFVDVRGHVLNNGEWAANVGVGGYYFSECMETILGLNAYYDYRTGKYSHYNQVGVGAELLGECWEARINGYIPVGCREGSHCTLYDDYNGDYLVACRKKERSLAGVDAEIGYLMKYQNPCGQACYHFDLYSAIGPYYFSTKCGPNVFGGQLRFLATWMNCFNLELIASRDKVYHTRVQGRIGIELPLGGNFFAANETSSGNCNTSCLPRDVCCERVYRREIIALEEDCCWKTNYDNNGVLPNFQGNASSSGKCWTRSCR